MSGVVRTHTDRDTLTSGERKYAHRSWRKVDRDGRHNRDSVKGFVEELWQRLFRIGEMLTHLVSKHIVIVCGNPPPPHSAASPEEGGPAWMVMWPSLEPSLRKYWPCALPASATPRL